VRPPSCASGGRGGGDSRRVSRSRRGRSTTWASRSGGRRSPSSPRPC
jgi:hypothetical protein